MPVCAPMLALLAYSCSIGTSLVRHWYCTGSRPHWIVAVCLAGRGVQARTGRRQGHPWSDHVTQLLGAGHCLGGGCRVVSAAVARRGGPSTPFAAVSKERVSFLSRLVLSKNKKLCYCTGSLKLHQYYSAVLHRTMFAIMQACRGIPTSARTSSTEEGQSPRELCAGRRGLGEYKPRGRLSIGASVCYPHAGNRGIGRHNCPRGTTIAGVHSGCCWRGVPRPWQAAPTHATPGQLCVGMMP